jgi:hypothetical protein
MHAHHQFETSINRALLVDLAGQELTADHHTTTTPQYQTITMSITASNISHKSTLLMS